MTASAVDQEWSFRMKLQKGHVWHAARRVKWTIAGKQYHRYVGLCKFSVLRDRRKDRVRTEMSTGVTCKRCIKALKTN